MGEGQVFVAGRWRDWSRVRLMELRGRTNSHGIAGAWKRTQILEGCLSESPGSGYHMNNVNVIGEMGNSKQYSIFRGAFYFNVRFHMIEASHLIAW